MSTKSSFKQRVLCVVAAIPRGSVLTYRQVAELAGSPLAMRAVGTIMRNNFNPSVPCHRVVRSDGKVGKYNRGDDNKLKRLRAEGVIIEGGRIVGIYDVGRSNR